ncbi:DNA-directed DNA polymerase POL5 [Aspergillus stella-maris]|uniref:DNA-directed DNA polymerase POL5 n=1 Tax=Aspergillus stella-maris TaxID=1810926 RepID=UPI003CCCFD9B
MPPHHAGSKKRRREPINVNTKLVEIYEDLASENDEIRLKAAQALVSQFTPDKTPTDEEVQKTLSRLFRGLCSSRKAARIGFSIALTEVLAQVFGKREAPLDLDVKGVLGVWENVSNAAGGESGQEARDHHFGRLFGAEAIIKSSILFSPKALLPEWTKVLELVFDLAKKKPWIREECGWIIFRCIHEIAAQKADSKLVETALALLVSSDLARTPEGVAIWLAARDLFPGINFPAKVWKHDDPLDSKERNQLTKAMKESSSGDAEGEGEKGAKASGVWNSKLHFAWEAVMGSLSKEKESKKGSRLGFADFWTEVVDNGLFASASSEERKYWGFLLFIKVMNEHSPEVASQTFTKNLVRCLTNQLAVEDRYLHRMAVKASKAIQARVSREPEFAAPAVKGLMGSAGVVNFDQMTKTKTVEKIVSEANIDALETILPLFESLVVSPGTTDGKAAAANRQVLAGLLLSMVRAYVADDSSEVVLERTLFVFARFAYFTSEDGKVGPQPAFSEQSQELFRSRINSSLNSIIAGQKHAATLPYAVVRKIRDAARSEEYGKFIIKMDDTLKESVKGAFKALKKLSSSETPAPGTNAFKLLYSMTILQVYNGDADAASMLDELDFCYNKIFASDKKSKKKTEKAEETSEASDALVEILLSFASKPSQLFRRMSEQVFTAFAPSVTATGLESLISILEAKESLAGQQEMFDQQDDEEDIGEDEEGDSDEDMMDVDEEDSDVEIVNPDDENDNDEQGSDNEDEAEESSNEEDAAEIAAFEAKLASALGTHRADKDLQAEESSSDEDMSDSEMDAIDTQLVKVFRARRDALSKKSDKKDAKENMVNFKNRVLDLLEIYVKKKECHSSILCLDLILPLLRLTRRSTVKQISARANNVLREYTKLCKGPSLPSLSDEEEIESVWSLLKDVHEEAKRSGPPTHASGASQASLLLVKVLTAHDKAFVGGVVDVYAETRKSQLLDKKCHVQPGFFTDWSNWCVSAGKAMKE